MESTDTPTDRLLTNQRQAEGMLLLTTLIWGGTFGATKVLLDSGLLPIGLLIWRFGIASIVFPLLFHHRLRASISVRTLLRGAALGSLLFAGFALQTLGLGATSSSRSGFITALYVIFTPLLQIIFIRRAPSRNVLLGVAFVLLGLWGLTAPGGTVDGLFVPWREGGFGIGDLLTLACAFVFAVYIILLDRFAPEGDEIAPMTLAQLLTASLLLVVYRPMIESWTMPDAATEWGLILFLSILATVLTTFWQTRYQPLTTPTRASVIFTMESVFAAIFAASFLSERMGVIAIAGGALIVAGLLITELGGSWGKKNSDRH